MTPSIKVTQELINNIINLSIDAGRAIMEIYNTDFDVKFKSDNSPVTKADRRAHDIIKKGLSKINPDIPILSEEGLKVSYNQRKSWKYFWMVDPLDGTKEFIKKNGEFTVNIALIVNNEPCLGIVYAPYLDVLYWGGKDCDAYKSINNEKHVKIKTDDVSNKLICIAISRSHVGEKMQKFLNKFNNYKTISMGSSLKICSVADGLVDFYPRLGPTMEWDTAASHAILKSAGGEIFQYGKNTPLKYNKYDLLNPRFIAGKIRAIKQLNLKESDFA